MTQTGKSVRRTDSISSPVNNLLKKPYSPPGLSAPSLFSAHSVPAGFSGGPSFNKAETVHVGLGFFLLFILFFKIFYI